MTIKPSGGGEDGAGVPVGVRLRGWAAQARANPLYAKALIGAGLIAAADQASKFWIVNIVRLQEKSVPCAKNPDFSCAQIPLSPIFDLTFVRNKGASFGMHFEDVLGVVGSRALLALISLGVVAMLVSWLASATKPLRASAIAMVIGGALGNLYDRLAYGYVVDFLDFSGLFFPWVFNIADAAICVGVALLMVDFVLEGRDAKAAARAPSLKS